ncbi:MAG: hypothetical protein RIR17_175 [Planctomycetota bacterium]
MADFLAGLPKAELHLHIEGTLEPQFLLERARKHQIQLKYLSLEEVQKAYQFSNLQSFLDIYYLGMEVLRDASDFHDLAWAYFQKAALQGVAHAEIFLDPQAHISRGISMATVMEGLLGAVARARKELHLSIMLIPCFLRHLDEDSALDALHQCLPYRENIVAFGLDSSELGNPPRKFQKAFAKVRELGFRVTTHAGEEGTPSYICDSLDLLGAERIDHGVRCLEDHQLMERLIRQQIPLTVCPLSNKALKVFPDLSKHPIRKMLNLGLLASIHSDDPAYFGGYIGENYSQCEGLVQLSHEELALSARNSIRGSFLGKEEKSRLLEKLCRYCESQQVRLP